jgi:Cu/Ag efflux pump CusA
MRSFAEFDLRNKVLAVSGVAQVVAIGGELQQFQINVRQDQLALYGLTISDVVAAARGAHSTANAGYLSNWENQQLPICQVARASGIDSVQQMMVKFHNGTPVVIGLVADVQLGPAPKRGTAADRGMPAVVVSVQKSPRTNTLELTK